MSATIGPIDDRKVAVEPAIAVKKMNFCHSSRWMSGDSAMSSFAALPASTKELSVLSGFLSARPKRIIAKALVCLITPGDAMTVAM